MEPFAKNARFSGARLVKICRQLRGEGEVSRSNVRTWTDKEILGRKDPKTGNTDYSFLDVVKAKVAASLVASKKCKSKSGKIDGAIVAAIRRLDKILTKADANAGSSTNPAKSLSGITIFTEGIRIVFETDAYRLDARTGQLLFQFDNETEDIAPEEGFGWIVKNAS